MRILHTSDWHLGKTLDGHSRVAEHEAFLDELVELAQDVDVVLLSGDVFDVYNPPIEAEELFFDTMARLGEGRKRAVVVIAGNHDSPDRLAAPLPLSATHGVFILGRPGDEPRAPRSLPGGGKVVLADSAPSVLHLDLPCGERAVVAALPYPSETRLRSLVSESLQTRERRAAYTQRVRDVFADLASHFRPETVNLATSHLFVESCSPSDSERALVGGAYRIDASALPNAQYTALGHLHKAQDVIGAPGPARYCGAPLAFRMNERDYNRSHTLVEVTADGPTHVHTIPISAGRPLVRWEVEGGLEQVFREVEAGLHANAFIELRVHVDQPLNHSQMAALKRLPRDFLRIHPVLPEALTDLSDERVDRRKQPLSEVFKAFYRTQNESREPDESLVELFNELADAALGKKEVA